MRGYAAIGVENGKFPVNLGTLWRTANIMGAAFVFTIGERYQSQPSDTMKTPRHVPLFTFSGPGDLWNHMPDGARLVGIEMRVDARPLASYTHPERAIYVLGAEDHGLSDETLDLADHIVVLPGDVSMNVAVAGSIVLYDRWTKTYREAA